MKRFLLLALALVLTVSVAVAEDLGVQVIGGPDAGSTAVSLDDLQLGTTYSLDGYAVVAPREMKTVDCFAQFGESGDYGVYQANPHSGSTNTSFAPVYAHSESRYRNDSWQYIDASWMDSGDTANFAWLLMDVTNLQKTSVDFTEEVTIKVVYQDDYEFNGWIRQIVYDHMEAQNGDKGLSRYGYEKDDYPNEIVLNPANVEAIDMMYTGTYVFGCTLPNYVLEDKKSPLRIEIQLGDNDLTYNIRK